MKTYKLEILWNDGRTGAAKFKKRSEMQSYIFMALTTNTVKEIKVNGEVVDISNW